MVVGQVEEVKTLPSQPTTPITNPNPKEEVSYGHLKTVRNRKVTPNLYKLTHLLQISRKK
jgi:hypothetical protein